MEELRRAFERRPAGVNERTSPDDPLFAPESAEHYFRSAQIALGHIRLALLAAPPRQVRAALDFACGYGRVLRMLRAEFPQARLVACDVNGGAVDFCAEAFDAEPVYSDADPDRIEVAGPFDLIWSGSFFTHIDERDWTRFLELLASLLAPGGVLVFTTAGRNVVELMRAGELAGLSEQAARKLVDDYDRAGFGFSGFPDRPSYGLARATPAWVCERIAATPGLLLTGYVEARDSSTGRQDVVSCVRSE
jgi:SAM-dependent methyltransferase